MTTQCSSRGAWWSKHSSVTEPVAPPMWSRRSTSDDVESSSYSCWFGFQQIVAITLKCTHVIFLCLPIGLLLWVMKLTVRISLVFWYWSDGTKQSTLWQMDSVITNMLHENMAVYVDVARALRAQPPIHKKTMLGWLFMCTVPICLNLTYIYPNLTSQGLKLNFLATPWPTVTVRWLLWY